MRYQVPQYIDIEDKIIGPLTLKQFLFVILVPGVLYILRFFVEPIYLIIIGIVFLPITLALAFVKIGSRPLRIVVKDFFMFAFRPSIYIWQRRGVKSPPRVLKKKTEAPKDTKIAFTQEGINELARKLDLGEGITTNR